jgi:predicted enzyme related to lactoylglutathione lyase
MLQQRHHQKTNITDESNIKNQSTIMSDENKTQGTPGTIGWNEMVTTDSAASIKFYTDLLGWTTETMELPDGMQYTMFKQGDIDVGGCVQCPTVDKPTWLQYISTDDIDASAAKAKELGATVTERVDIPMGSFVVVTDPLGATFAFWQCNPDYTPPC